MRMRFSKLYTFGGCFKGTQSLRSSDQEQLLGGKGFSRVVFCNQTERHAVKPYKYRNNYVSTTKYNVLTFLPKALFEQFRRVANLYFLLAAALALTPVSPYSAASLIAPLVFVVGVSMCKEALEDWRRFRQVGKAPKNPTSLPPPPPPPPPPTPIPLIHPLRFFHPLLAKCCQMWFLLLLRPAKDGSHSSIPISRLPSLACRNAAKCGSLFFFLLRMGSKKDRSSWPISPYPLHFFHGLLAKMLPNVVPSSSS